MIDHFAAFRKKKTIVDFEGNLGNQGNYRPEALQNKGLRLVPRSDHPGEPLGDPGNQTSLAETDLDERIAIAEMEGGVPALYSEAFARLQLTPPADLSVKRWLQFVDSAGRFLDAHSGSAVRLGWTAEDLFAADGLIRSLYGASVVSITAARDGACGAMLSDGRTFTRTRKNDDWPEKSHLTTHDV